MFEQRQGHDQRQQPLLVVPDKAQELLLVFAGEVILQVAHHRQGSGTPQVLDPSGVHMPGPGRFAYSPSLRSAQDSARRGPP
jgi:hypothetical protein